MANFVVVVDPDSERRSRFVKAIEPLLPPVEGLLMGRCTSGNFCALWAAAECAPISQVTDNEGAAVIWGEAIAGPGSKRVNATELKQLWNDRSASAPATFDGFYAAVVYQRDLGIIVGADLLGLFPVYYYASGEVLLVGSSPELFRHHPAFRMEFNPRGLVGVLLTMHIFNGQTLLRGVKRLAAGHVLVWKLGASPEEVRQYTLPVSHAHFDLSFSDHVNILDRILDETITRHVPLGKRSSLLLSGGLDSRMIGGFLKRNGISDITALTLGLPTDIEMRCAIPVARTLGFEHHAIENPFDLYPDYAHLEAKWQHSSTGFNNIMHWGTYPHLRKSAPHVIMGHVMDAVLSPMYWAYSPPCPTKSYERFFSYHNRCGLESEVLKKLLRRDIFGKLVEETVAGIRMVYQNHAELESQRAWCFELHHRQRFHVGSSAWVHSFGAWPLLPVLDRSLLETVGAMPGATLADRRAQKSLLCARFPELAALPLDRNSYNSAPLEPRLRWRLLQYALSCLAPVGRVFGSGNHGGRERRYYYRIYDLNGPGWRAVRRQAEPYRERVHELFNMDMLDTLLPPPDVPLQLRDGIVDASGLKSLLGFMLWSHEHLS